MATGHMTIEEAARHLGVTDRTVRGYISQGLLGTHKVKGSKRKWLAPDEVEELRLDRLEVGRLDGASLRKELQLHRSQLRRMRAELDVVLKMLDTQREPLGIQKNFAPQLYQAAVDQLRAAEWDIRTLASWANVFLRIDENDFQVVREAVDDPKPWVPFLKLCLRMSQFLVEQPSYKTSVELQGLHREMNEGRRRLRISALCFMDLHSYDMDAAIRRAQLADSPRSVQDVLLSLAPKK
jgi:excisionase family DNA binding protein